MDDMFLFTRPRLISRSSSRALKPARLSRSRATRPRWPGWCRSPAKGKREFGSMRGKISIGPEFFEPPAGERARPLGPIASAAASRYACTDLVVRRGPDAVERRPDGNFRSCQRSFRERRLGLGNCDKIPDWQTAPCSGAGSGSFCGDHRSGLSRTADQSAAWANSRQPAWSSSRSLRPDADFPSSSFRPGSRLQRGRLRPYGARRLW